MRLAPEQALQLPGRGADLGESVGASRTRQSVAEHRQRRFRAIRSGAERRQASFEFRHAGRTLCLVFPPQFPQRRGHRVAHGAIPKRSKARAAAATNAGAVLQCPRTSAPTRAAITALLSSTTATSGWPGH